MKFQIFKDKHYSDQFLYKSINFLNLSSILTFKVNFDKSCIYNLNSPDQLDINKLFGFSNGFNHHKYSARFGWNSENDKINIFSYVYDNGKRKSNPISTIECGKYYKMAIVDDNTNWIFSIDNYFTMVPKSEKFKIGYKLWPYFGGNITSPHDMSIELINFS